MLEDDLDYSLKVHRTMVAQEDMVRSIMERARVELANSCLRFPQPNYVALKVAEEVGEMLQAAVHYSECRGKWEDVEKEAVQAIAMCLRLLVEGDEINGVIPPHLT